eukprot:TRINITY_DN255_c0_g1_i1.p1 TRINITY_DN255_c0_g1~~TRINITY_DN255_c0_g1_i1.p1  ORF type:complete len:110 (+),score=24.09 TRINITY_DN255_c0_g1_i1:93-422(+)
MVVAIRLSRFGQRNTPYYRIVVADSRAPRDGKFIEQIGAYNPLRQKDNSKEVVLDFDRVKYWLSVGAQPSERIAKLLSFANVLPTPPVPARKITPTTVTVEETAEATTA